MKTESGKRLEILLQLRDHGECYGLEMVNRAGSTLKRGTIYVALNRLVDDGLVVDRPAPRGEGSRLPTRLYALRDDGRRAINAAAMAQVGWDAPLGIEAVA
ncbi:MAG: helix-turn-helix transcriptional regulator [Acidobacteria bacterium]|nr:helix-turn-helix transcriptional regulator [Acidobacteriota bacterium]